MGIGIGKCSKAVLYNSIKAKHDVHARLTFFPGELLSEQMLLSSALGLPPLARWGVAV